MIVNHSGGNYEVVPTTLHDALRNLPAENRIVTDHTVRAVAGQELRDRCVSAVPPGEKSKDLATFGGLLRWLAETKTSRKTSLVALGGGVVGDLAGFVAASYMRGIPFIQIPTTLLAMVDSSVGGKVGIDLPEGKNLAGAFKPPTAVYLPIDMLRELPERQFRNGMAEVLKYGFIMDEQLADTLHTHRVTGAGDQIESIVIRCVKLKADVVQEDEFETTGGRAILNFGHTIGHAIEHVRGFGEILHGEAIAIGMVLEAKLGQRIGVTAAGVADRVAEDLARYGLPTTLDANLSPDALLDAMARDKKVVDGSLAFSLLQTVGRCKLVHNVAEEAVRDVLIGR